MIDVDNLTHTLPCAFELQRRGATAACSWRPESAHEVDEGGTVGVRSEWVGLTADFQVNRPLNNSMSIQWGVFHFRPPGERGGLHPQRHLDGELRRRDSGKVRASSR